MKTNDNMTQTIDKNRIKRERAIEYSKRYYLINHVKVKEHKKQYYQENREKLLERCKQYAETHKIKIVEDKRRYYQNHKEEKKEYRKRYYRSHKKEVKEYRRQYYKTTTGKANILKIIYKRRRNLGFVPINKPFIGNEAHHIDWEYIIYIPKWLHKSISHCLKTGRNMVKINKLAFQYLIDNN